MAASKLPAMAGPRAQSGLPQGCEGSEEMMVDRLDRHAQNLLRRKVGEDRERV